jgi:hypothetical protein
MVCICIHLKEFFMFCRVDAPCRRAAAADEIDSIRRAGATTRQP